MKTRISFLFLAFFFFTLLRVSASKPDSLIFKNGDIVVGELKKMDRNILEIETDYSDADFKAKWDGLKEVYTKTLYLITLTDGSRQNGSLRSAGSGKVSIVSDEGKSVEVSLLDIVTLDDMDRGFWSQIYGAIDIGFDLTKANDFMQFQMRSNLGYVAKRWQLSGYFNTLSSVQKETDDLRRTEGGVSYKYFLPHDWYPLVSADFLSSTELQLKLRSTAKLGLGKYVIHTNRLYWGFNGGANFNNEDYSADSVATRQSWEGFLATELNLFNIGDLSLLTNLSAYPSFTESGRWRVDYNFDAKYDLPMDFYISLGFTFNYDNMPAPGSTDTDYVLHTGFGWSW